MIPPAFLDELRARSPLPAIIGRRVRLARSGRQWKGCCPFHGEKTPSFYVYDDHYHCFGCGAHGDVIAFVMQSQGAPFTEAVEHLAGEAGMSMPLPTQEAAEAERRRHTLHDILGAAADSFRRRLRLPEGRPALDYLRGRGLSEETIERFGLGWSGEGRGALLADLGRAGITTAQLVEAGLMREADGRTSDLFFNRVMFPIRDRRSRTISFGGRVLGDGQPKYVNGPETVLFSKRRTLYGLDTAREAIQRGGPLLVVEGYMDVIALAQVGLQAAVAPLGTALTEEQLTELWALSPCPVLCFDGDSAGARAAARAAELVLPMLTPDRTLRLAALPPGEDPDSLAREQGAAGVTRMVRAARPLAAALYDLLRPQGADATPEQRAAFRVRLEEAARRIPHHALSREYHQSLLEQFYADGRTRERRPAPSRRTSSPRPEATAAQVAAERGRILGEILRRNPALLPDVEDAYTSLPLDPAARRLRDALLADPPATTAHTADLEAAAAEWWHIFHLLHADRLREDIAAARIAAEQDLTPDTQRRLCALVAALSQAESVGVAHG